MGSAVCREDQPPAVGGPGPCSSQQAGQEPSWAGPGSALPHGTHSLPARPSQTRSLGGVGFRWEVLLGGPQEALGSVPRG